MRMLCADEKKTAKLVKFKPPKYSRVLSGRLIRQSFCRLRLPGLIGLALLAAGAFCRSDTWVEWAVVYMRELLSMQNVLMLLVPIMCLLTFGHGNRRAEADVYDALPVRRIARFWSGIAAVLLWALLLIAVRSLLELRTLLQLTEAMTELGAKTARYAVLGYANLLFAALKAFAMSVLTAGAFALAMAATGTYVTNAATGLVILLAPAALMQSIVANLRSVAFMDTEHGVVGFFGTIYNLFARFFFSGEGGFLGGGYALTIESDLNFPLTGDTLPAAAETVFDCLPDVADGLLPCLAYSFLLGAAYLAIASLLYKRRKSEIAQRPAWGRGWQAVLHIIPTFLFFVIGTNRLVSQLLEGTDERTWTFLWWYATGLLFYVFYEWIVTKSVQRVCKSLLLFPIAPVLAAVVGVLSYGAVQSAAGRLPAADEIVSVRMEGLFGSYEPFAAQMKKLDLVTDETKTLVADALEDVVTEWRSGEWKEIAEEASVGAVVDYEALFWTTDEIGWPLGGANARDELDGVETAYTVYATIKTKTGTFRRRIKFASTDLQTLADALNGEPAIATVTPTLCDLRDTAGESLYCNCLGWALTDEQLLKLYQTYREEVQTIEKPYRIFLGQEVNREGVLDYLQDMENEVDFPITADTPKTAALLCNLLTEQCAGSYDLDAFVQLAKQCDVDIAAPSTVNPDGTPKSGSNAGQTVSADTVSSYATSDEISLQFNFIYYDDSEQQFSTYSEYFATDGATYRTMTLTSEELDALVSILKPHENEEVTFHQDAILIVLYTSDATAGHWYNLTETDAARLKEMLNMMDYIRANYEEYNAI